MTSSVHEPITLMCLNPPTFSMEDLNEICSHYDFETEKFYIEDEQLKNKLCKIMTEPFTSGSVTDKKYYYMDIHNFMDNEYENSGLFYANTMKDFIKNIRFMDDSFVINKKRVYEFCDLIEKNKFKLNLQFLSSVKHVDYDLFCRMKSVGFYHVSLGIESGNQDILNLINKKTQIEDIKKSIDIIKKVGLNVECLYMVGNIGETEKTMNDTISFAHKLKTIVHVQIAIPYPGTKFYEIYKQYGHITTENFNNFTTDDPVFIPNTLNKEMLINARSRGNTRSAGIL